MNLNKNKAQLISGDLIKLWEQAPSGDMSAKAGIQAFLIIATMFSIFALTMTILTAGISIGLLAVSFSLGVFCMINVYLKEENQIKNARSLHQLATTVPTPDETAKQSIFKLSASFFKPSGETTIANDTSNVYHSEYSQVL